MRETGFLKKMNEGKYIVTRFTCDEKSIKMRYYIVINTFKHIFLLDYNDRFERQDYSFKEYFFKKSKFKRNGNNFKFRQWNNIRKIQQFQNNLN